MPSAYQHLLSSERFRASSVQDRNIVSESESDRGRLLFCPAFRRLQQKAQVFSMESNAAVRSRLTHSLEVSQMGRYIADLVSVKLQERELASGEECNALVTFVETACLMHDIGNPPFGHFGEAAIRDWFGKKGADAVIATCSTGGAGREIGTTDPRLKNALADFLEFDGNPQGLRVVTKLQRNSDEYGLNLTKSTIASYLKYVRSSTEVPCPEKINFTKKCGYFSTEKSIVEDIWRAFGYSGPKRFPLAYIMEAADDIAYCISDLEDSIEKGLLDKDKALPDIYREWREVNMEPLGDKTCQAIDVALKNACAGEAGGKVFTYTDFRTSLNRELAQYSSNQYIDNHEAILAGELPALIDQQSPAGRVLEIIKSYCRANVYCHETVQRVELAGYTAIYGLLEKFSCLLECDFERFGCSLDYGKNKDGKGRPIVIEKKILTLFPKNYIKVYEHELRSLDSSDEDYRFAEWNLRAHLVTDFLSGMTDDFAMSMYQSLSGMKL